MNISFLTSGSLMPGHIVAIRSILDKFKGMGVMQLAFGPGAKELYCTLTQCGIDNIKMYCSQDSESKVGSKDFEMFKNSEEALVSLKTASSVIVNLIPLNRIPKGICDIKNGGKSYIIVDANGNCVKV